MRHFLLNTILFAVVAAVSYLALASGFGWVVGVFFVAGILYATWLLLAPPAAPALEGAGEELAEIEEPALEEPSARESAIRAKVMEEVVWGKLDPEVMAFAESLVGPRGNKVAKYIELRVAQLSGEA
jgi:hypothetical protein